MTCCMFFTFGSSCTKQLCPLCNNQWQILDWLLLGWAELGWQRQPKDASCVVHTINHTISYDLSATKCTTMSSNMRCDMSRLAELLRS